MFRNYVFTFGFSFTNSCDYSFNNLFIFGG
nr:MAG TPA: hypothetical protein [Caudoviricetes sp.]